MTTKTLTFPPRPASTWANALLLGAFSFALAYFGGELVKISGQISPLWFPTTLLTVLVFRQSYKSLPLLLTCCFIAIVIANLLVVGFSIKSLKYPLLNLAQALMGGMLLRKLLDREKPLDSLVSWSKMFIAVGLLMPLIGGLMASWFTGHHTFRFFSIWVVSESLGMLALGPICLLWQPLWLHKKINKNQWIEAILTLIFTLILCYCALRYLPWQLTAVMVILLYSAVRLPRFGAFVVFFATLLMMMLAFNTLEIHSARSGFMVDTPWLPFLLVMIPSHVMALVMHSFREEKKHISESETRFRHAMEYSAIGIALVSPDGRWLQVNKSLCKLVGYDESELTTMTFQQITHPDDMATSQHQFEALLRGEIETYNLEKRYLRKDGQIIWALLAVSLVRNSEGQPLYLITQIEDFTGLKQSQDVNRYLMQRITLANEAGEIGVWEWNLKTGEMSWDKRMFQIYGLPEEGKATYLTWANSLHPVDRQVAIDAFDDAIKASAPVDIVFRILTTAFGIRYIHSKSTMVLNDKGDVERMLGINQDVTAIRQLTYALYQEKERMRITLDAIGEAVISTDEKMRVTFMNPVAENMCGCSQTRAAGKPVSEIINISHGSDDPALENLRLSELPRTKFTTGLDQELILHNDSGQQFDIHISITPLKTEEGDDIGCVIVIQDVSESRKTLRRLSYSASHDMLTQLPNRVSFEQKLQALLHSANTDPQTHALVFIDLDHFKAVNDSAGHAAGDALLHEISGVMQSNLRDDDFLARLGGDEFGVLLQACSLQQAQEITTRLVEAVSSYPFKWKGSQHQIGASAGITLLGDSNSNMSEVLSQADLACYSAKHNGRSQLSVFPSKLLNKR